MAVERNVLLNHRDLPCKPMSRGLSHTHLGTHVQVQWWTAIPYQASDFMKAISYNQSSPYQRYKCHHKVKFNQTPTGCTNATRVINVCLKLSSNRNSEVITDFV